MMLKDMRLAQAAAAESGATTELAALATRFYQDFFDAGNGESDFSGVFEAINKR